MITEKELLIANESPTKKDLYQIYPEILELVTKITERWDPSTSNESDPGVVLLKLLAFMADKHNYNIDKNVLECFMPSCTQEDSMRKLCDMMGYEMKYIQSATTTLTMMFQGTDLDDGDKYIYIPAHTAVTNTDNDITYTLLEDVYISKKYEQKTIEAIEGEYVTCEANDSNIIKLYNIDDNFRFYLPESQIAENGIYVESIDDTVLGSSEDIKWEKVNNLNTHRAGSYVWKFGYDSKKQLPYIQFPEDISALIGDGLTISYIRTTGVNGNVSAGTLIKLSSETQKLINTSSNEVTDISLTEENFVIKNVAASVNGKDKEDLDSAYNNFKKIIGTFDTLVTCRDYANAIYNLVSSKDNTTPLVSNVQISDIRDDLNRSYSILTYDSNGLIIKEEARYDEKGDPKINHFDLYFYTFKPITGEYTKSSYKNSFKYSSANLTEIKQDLAEEKTISHSIKEPAYDDLVAIKNYYDLKAKITTTYKVNTTEENAILSAIYKALYENFNMRKVDWGEEIPFDSILSVIQNADTRIKNVSLEEPEIVTAFLIKGGAEYREGTNSDDKYKTYYKASALKNILAGRIPLLRYEKSFITELGETMSKIKQDGSYAYENVYYGNKLFGNWKITHITTTANLPVPTASSILKLDENEVVQFIAPNYTTTITYPSYVNYYLELASSEESGTERKTYIPAGTEYKLQVGDKLYINYTDSNDNVYNLIYLKNTDNKDVILHYTNNSSIPTVEEAPAIGNVIKPNFDLYDSRYIKANSYKKYAKTSGYNFGSYTEKVVGMFSLGTSEQVEVRDYVKSKLTDTWKCYWLIQDGEIPFDSNNEYVLQEGEYFFYTNEAMTELVTLGSGTRLYNPKRLPFKLPDDEDIVDIEDIASKGIAAFESSVWINKHFTEDNYLEIQEMQIITLTNGDKVTSMEGVVNTKGEAIDTLSNVWLRVDKANWAYSDGTSGYLPTLLVDTDKWRVRSRLDLNIGPTTYQKLKGRDFIICEEAATKTTVPQKRKAFSGDVNKTSGEETLLYIKSNYLLQKAGGDHISVQITVSKADGTYEETDDLVVKAFEYTEPAGKELDESGKEIEKTLELSDYNTYFTKISLKKFDSVNLNCLLKKKSTTWTEGATQQYGALMLYYINGLVDEESGTIRKGASVEFRDIDGHTGTEVKAIRFLNKWKDSKNLMDYTNELPLNIEDSESGELLNERINIIQINQPGTLIIKGNDDTKGNIIISQLEIINETLLSTVEDDTDMGVDTDLLNINKIEAKAFMKAIYDADIDHIFYYTGAPVDNTSCIDLNTDAGENLASAVAWYDYNNICNKFVISELDAEKFSTGITLTKSSRLS